MTYKVGDIFVILESGRVTNSHYFNKRATIISANNSEIRVLPIDTMYLISFSMTLEEAATTLRPLSKLERAMR